MKVCIVTPNYAKDSSAIIARLARHLEDGNGWRIATKPNPRALVNVFMPYDQWRFSKWNRTPTAGWFTHKEIWATEHGAKRRRWEAASRALDLRVTPSAMYARELRLCGSTVHIPHPVEVDHFTPKPMRKHKKPMIGVSGRVYPGGRKGEAVVARLAKEHRWNIVASGSGWPIPTKWYEWSELPRFYHQLDVFLCTSLIEGGPVTVLEALACGKPVVIPWGVGAMDELPEVRGIWHYYNSEYQNMVGAIEKALQIRSNPDELRHIVSGYTAKRWCQAWDGALHDLIRGMA